MRKLFMILVMLGVMGANRMEAQVISTFPYSYDFENETTGPVTACPIYTMVEPGWLNAGGDNYDWTTDVNSTGSANTGPDMDHSPSGIRYMYLESSPSGTCAPSSAVRTIYLETPEFDFTSMPGPFVSFWYHMYGSTIGTLTLEIDITGTGSWVQVFSISGEQQTSSADPWKQAIVPLQAYGGVPSVKFRFVGSTTTGTSSFTGDIAIDDFMIDALPQTDVGISSINSPQIPFHGTTPIDVTLTNHGVATITSTDIEWSINGVAQTTQNWVGSLTGGAQTSVNLGNYNFTPGNYTLKFWTNAPNGSVDDNFGNDTIEVDLCTALSGTYTLGGTTADFNAFSDLANVVNTCGMVSHVIINVNPGTYAERLILNDIPGASATSTLTIDGGSPAQVSITNNALSNIFLNGSDWVIISNLTLENSGTSDAYGVQLRDSAMNNTIQNCIINMSTNTSLSDVIGISASNSETSSTSEGANAFWTTVSGNTILGGEKGIHFEGASAARNIGNVIMNNIIDSTEDYGVFLDDQDSIKVIGNRIQNIRNSNGDGISIDDVMMFEISYNYVHAPDYGIDLNDGNFDAVSTSRGKIVNNMVYSDTDYGIYLDDIEETDVWHNTVYNVSGTSGAFRVNDMMNLDIRNNIFMSETDYAFESLDNITTGGNAVDYNNYWTPSNNTKFIYDGVATGDLISWQTAQPTANLNAVALDPIFNISANELRIMSIYLEDRGDNSVGVVDDIDGDTRPMGASVDLGADEFTLNTIDAGFEGYIGMSGVICGDSLMPIVIVVKNYGDTIYNMSIDVEITGDANQTFTYSYSGILPFHEMDTLIVGTMNTTAGSVFNVKGYVTLANEQDFSNDTLFTSFVARPIYPVGYDATVCSSDTAVLSALSLPGTTYGWYDAPVGGNLVQIGDTYSVSSITSQGTYYLDYMPDNDSLVMGTLAGNGCSGGNMFDMTSYTGTPITGFSVSSRLGAGTPITVTVHYIANGTYVGNETNAAAWTTHGSFNAVSVGSNPGEFTKIDFSGTPIIIPAGATYAFYIEYSSNYTDGNNIISNADISVSTGAGLCSAFSGVNPSRTFNGVIHYVSSRDCSVARSAVTAVSDTAAVASYTAATTHNLVDFDATATIHQDSVSWDFGDGNTGAGVQTSHTYQMDSTYTVCLYAYSYCGTDTVCQTMDVCDSIGGNFTYSVNGLVTTFTDLSAGNPVSWLWNFGDGTSSNLQNPVHTYANDSSYIVSLVVTNYCGEVSVSNALIQTVGIADYSNESLVEVWPNPSKGIFYTNLANYEADDIVVGVYDQLGKVVYQSTITKDQDRINHIIDLSGKAKGLYFLRIASEQGVLTKKLVIN